MLWLWLCAPTALAEDENSARVGPQDRPGPRVVAAIEGNSIAEAVLVGPSGQLYQPSGTGTWQRTTAGGVAADVSAVLNPAAGQLFVVSSRSPLYRLTDGSWNAVRLARRGRTRAAHGGGAAVLVVGRDVHLWREGAWASVAHARGDVSAVFASSESRVYAALRRGAIDRWSGGSWTRIALPGGSFLGDGRFAGRPGEKLFLLSDTGAILDILSSRATLVTQPADLQGFSAHVGAVDSTGGLWVAGVQAPILAPEQPAGGAPPETAPAAAAQAPAPRALLLHRPGRGKHPPLALVEALTMVAPGDLITLLICDDTGAVLLATDAGQVHLRAPSGTWSAARMSTDLPAKQFRSESVRPARTR